MFGHILPNALTPVVSFAPFVIVANISSLVALDFLGFGLGRRRRRAGASPLNRGPRTSAKMVARVLSPRRPLPHAALRRLHRRGRTRGVRSQGVLAPAIGMGGPSPSPRDSRSADVFLHGGGRGQSGGRRRPRRPPRRGARSRGGIGIRQKRHGPERAAARARSAGEDRRGRGSLRRTGTCWRSRGTRCARSAARTSAWCSRSR